MTDYEAVRIDNPLKKHNDGSKHNIKHRGTDTFAMYCKSCFKETGVKISMILHRKYLWQSEVVIECPKCGKSMILNKTPRCGRMETMEKLLKLEDELQAQARKAYYGSYTIKPSV